MIFARYAGILKKAYYQVYSDISYEFQFVNAPLSQGVSPLFRVLEPVNFQEGSMQHKTNRISSISGVSEPGLNKFNPIPFGHLSSKDQILFQSFGAADICPLPYECLHHAFEAQVKLTPTAIAAKQGDQSISYTQLNDQAELLARIMVHSGVRKGDFIGLFVRRSIEMLIGVLASLKVGAAYVPQDIGFVPIKQLQTIIDTADIKTVLSLSEYADQIPTDPDIHIIHIDKQTLQTDEAKQSSTRLPRTGKADDICFVLFTSGTTGKPKGVQVSHRNVCNIVHTEPGNLGVKPGMRVSHIMCVAFDMAAWEIFICLSYGGMLLIRNSNIEETIQQADIVIATPSILGSIDKKISQSVKTVAVAGEPCPRTLADAWARNCRFYNACGPTETTIVNTMQRHQPGLPLLTIGKPTPNNTVYILDDKQQALPIGETGEMWAGGDCVTQGYLKNNALNAERYRPDPFLGSQTMMFNTRDLGRWTQDGELEHIGRTDDQVKIRGFRVHLDAVSRTIEEVSGCMQVITLKDETGELLAFISPLSIDPAKVRSKLMLELPYYCIPGKIVCLDELPKTSRGKIDASYLRACIHNNHRAESAIAGG